MLNMAKAALKKEPTMVVTAGKYIVDIEKGRLILTHPTGISFDLTWKDALELAVLISNWRLAVEMGPYKREQGAKQIGKDEDDNI
jgi:hypothetical protein